MRTLTPLTSLASLVVPAAAGAALLLAGATAVQALPAVGRPAPPAAVDDADGRELRPDAQTGKPVLIIYESKASAEQNITFKEALNRMAAGGRYRDRVVVVPVAHVEGYDFWPWRALVKSSIRKESRKIGLTIYCDWTGAFREAYGLRPELSSVILIGRSGRVLFAAEGPLRPEAQQQVISLLLAELAS